MNSDTINYNVHPLQCLCISDLSITDGMYSWSTSTNAIIFLKPKGQANPYFPFGYGPQMILSNTQGQLSGVNKIWSNQLQSNIIHQHAKIYKLEYETQNHIFIPDSVTILKTRTSEKNLNQFWPYLRNWAKDLQGNHTCNSTIWK